MEGQCRPSLDWSGHSINQLESIMSRYDWESGAIVIPAKSYPKLKKALITERNAHLKADLEKAKAVYAQLKEKLKGRRRVTRAMMQALLYEVLESMPGSAGSGSTGNEYGFRILSALDLEAMFIKQDPESDRPSLRAVSAAACSEKPLARNAGHINADDCAVTFIDERRTVRWYVGENNKAVERARRSWLGQAFFRELNAISWTRGSGGELIGNDEYNRENRCAGGGANYVTARFGPLGAQVKISRSR